MENHAEQQKTTPRPYRRGLAIVALVVFVLATNVFLTRVVLEYTTPRVVAFDMKKTLDSFMDSVSQKQLSEAQSKRCRSGLTVRWSRAWRITSYNIMSSSWSRRRWFRALPM